MKSESLFDYSILISPNYAYDKEQFVERFNVFSKSELLKKKELHFFIGYGDDYENKFKPPLEKVIKVLTENKNQNINFEYEMLKVKGHGNTWYEGVYKGLMKWKP